MSKGRKSAYPFKPEGKSRPRSSHRATTKGRTWHDGGIYKFPIDERLKSFLREDLCSSTVVGNRAYAAFKRDHGGPVPVHEHNKKGRTLIVG